MRALRPYSPIIVTEKAICGLLSSSPNKKPLLEWFLVILPTAAHCYYQ